MEITIFYAWQSDRPSNVNRYLIRDAARDACERISEDESNEWNLDLDSDTKGVAGMCDIPNTILRKIRKSDIFLGDLTIVGKSEGTHPKMLPNTNVVIELGFAARHLGFGALIGVMNEAFGKVEGQVFDIKRRDCLKYTLSDGATREQRNKARQALSKRFEEVIRITIEQVVIPRRTDAEANKNETAEAIQREFAAKVASLQFEKFHLLPAVLTSVQFPPELKPNYPAVVDEVRAHLSENLSVRSDSIVWFSNDSVTKLSLGGQLLHVYGGDYIKTQFSLKFNRSPERAYSEEENRRLFDLDLQRSIVHHVYSHCQFLQRLGIKPPWLIGISLVGVQGFRLVPMNPNAASDPCEGDFNLPLVKVTAVKHVKDIQATASFLKHSLDHLCRHFGWDSSFHFTHGGFWNVR
jgi:hypothetical protein